MANRICEGCLAYDEEPMHIYYEPGGPHGGDPAALAGRTELDAQAIAEFVDGTFRNFHFACCFENGCPDGSCNPGGGG